jgi:hypothetical protein
MAVRIPSKLMLGFRVATLPLSFSHESPGEAVNGTLLGTVTGATGASIAKVIAAATPSGMKHKSLTNESGNCTFFNVPPVSCSVTVGAQGHKNPATRDL